MKQDFSYNMSKPTYLRHFKFSFLRNGGASAQSVTTRVLDDGELIGIRFPDVLGAVVVLGGDDDLISHKESRVETHTKLTNQLRGGLTVILDLSHLVEELAGSGLGDGTKVLHQFFFGHADTSVSDVKHVLFFVRLMREKRHRTKYIE